MNAATNQYREVVETSVKEYGDGGCGYCDGGEEEAAAEEERERASRAPAVASMSPADGDRAVDPSVTELVITFDRPMRADGYSLTITGAPFPKVTGQPAWRDERTFVLPVALEAGTTYGFSINGPGNLGFRAADTGEAVVPVPVSFTTR